MQAAAAVVFSVKPRFSSASPSVPRLRSHRGPPVAASAALGTTTSTESMAAKWAQKTVVIPPYRRGCHLITSKVKHPSLVLSRFLQKMHQSPHHVNCVPSVFYQIVRGIEQDLSGFKCGLAHLF
ncbi:hypothetical protein B296_00048053 [Ensete ventricosum]|uniref:Uncharacterized protein n=1 Tax=Ensete ventricosum TaxID=4639 RepID=A0A426YWM4_ENSVE|nr:hypothetical protein B296_00048053 [Ensete ventricosum]